MEITKYAVMLQNSNSIEDLHKVDDEILSLFVNGLITKEDRNYLLKIYDKRVIELYQKEI